MATEAQENRSDLEQEIIDLYRRLQVVNHYRLLQVSRSSSEAEIKKAYHRMAQRYHPDRYRTQLSSDLLEQLQEVFNQITTAYNTLTQPESRKEYDEELQLSEDAQVEGLSGQEIKKASELYAAGKEAYRNKDVLRAISIFEQLAAMAPLNAEYHSKLALCQMAVPKLRAEARKNAELAIGLNRENANYHALLGRILLKQREHDLAERAFRRALSWSPGLKTARQGLQEIADYREANRPDLKSRLKRKMKGLLGKKEEPPKARPRELRSRLAHEKPDRRKRTGD